MMQQEELFSLAQKYLDVLEQQGSEALSDEQHTLLAYCYLDSQVQEGGFIQLIASGYGEYIFQNPVADSLRRWKIKAVPKVLEQAAQYYQRFGAEIEKLASEEAEIDVIRERFPEFEELDGNYYEVADEDLEKILAYVHEHQQLFLLA